MSGIKELASKCQEVVQNNDEYTIDWNKLIVNLFMNKLYSSKTGIIYDSIQDIYIYI